MIIIRSVRVSTPLILLVILAVLTLTLPFTFTYRYYRWKLGLEDPAHMFFVDAFYYNTSKSFENDTWAILFNTRKYVPNLPITCRTKDKSGNVLESEALMEAVVHAPGQCQFTTFVAKCRAISNPEELSLSIVSARHHSVPFTRAVYQPRKLVVCMSRMYFFENWQLLFSSLEIYKHFGADLMVTYIESVISDMMSILKAYEKEGFVITKPGLRMFKPDDMDYDPNDESEWGSQLSAYNSCLFEFKESAEFIIFADWDDVLIPTNFNTYFEELSFLSQAYPKAGALVLPRIDAHVQTALHPRDFNISYTFNTLKPLKMSKAGKYVAIPSRVDGSWIHAASVVKDGYKQVWTREGLSLFWHFRKWTFYNETDKYSEGEKLFNGNAALVEESFRDLLKRHNLTGTFARLPATPTYYPALVQCYKEMQDSLSVNGLSKCPNPVQCNIPEFAIDCVNLKTEFSSFEFFPGVHWHQRTLNELYTSARGCVL